MNPLLAPIEIPARVASRIARDLDAIAEVARSVPRAIDLLESLDQTAKQVLALGERIDERGAELVVLGERFNAIGEQMLTEANLVHTRASEVVAQANEMVAVLPTVRRALEIGEPLEGAIERFARVVDRLPGGTAPVKRPATLGEAEENSA